MVLRFEEQTVVEPTRLDKYAVRELMNALGEDLTRAGCSVYSQLNLAYQFYALLEKHTIVVDEPEAKPKVFLGDMKLLSDDEQMVLSGGWSGHPDCIYDP